MYNKATKLTSKEGRIAANRFISRANRLLSNTRIRVVREFGQRTLREAEEHNLINSATNESVKTMNISGKKRSQRGETPRSPSSNSSHEAAQSEAQQKPVEATSDTVITMEVITKLE